MGSASFIRQAVGQSSWGFGQPCRRAGPCQRADPASIGADPGREVHGAWDVGGGGLVREKVRASAKMLAAESVSLFGQSAPCRFPELH